MPKAVTKDYLVFELQRVGSILGRTPTASAFDEHSMSAHQTIKNHFGSWNAGLREAGFSVNQEQNVESEIKLMSVVECAYVAGILDGEGHISVRKNVNRGSFDCKVCVANTSLALLNYLLGVTGGGRVIRHKLKKERAHHTNQYVIQWRVNEIEDLLPQVLPWLVVKKDDANNVLTYLRNRDKSLKIK